MEKSLKVCKPSFQPGALASSPAGAEAFFKVFPSEPKTNPTVTQQSTPLLGFIEMGNLKEKQNIV